MVQFVWRVTLCVQPSVLGLLQFISRFGWWYIHRIIDLFSSSLSALSAKTSFLEAYYEAVCWQYPHGALANEFSFFLVLKLVPPLLNTLIFFRLHVRALVQTVPFSSALLISAVHGQSFEAHYWLPIAPTVKILFAPPRGARGRELCLTLTYKHVSESSRLVLGFRSGLQLSVTDYLEKTLCNGA